jgi:trigger factor
MAKAKLKKIEDCTTLLEIEVQKTDIDKAFDEVYVEITKVANIPGFRQGKAPVEMVKKHYAKDAREEVLKRLIPESYKSALSEHSVRPIGLPEITDVKFEEAMLLSFKAKIDTRPNFKLKDYKGIKIEKKKMVITDADVDKMLDNLREMNAKYSVADDRPLEMGDYTVADVECSVDGKAIHKKRENIWLHIDKESVIPGLSEKLIGMKKDEEKDAEVKLPEKYPDKNVAGKTAVYHVKIKEIKTRQLPNLDDELAKTMGRNNLDDLKKEIRAELEARSKMEIEVDSENQLLNKLMDDNVFSVPSGFVARQLGFMVEEAKRHLMEKGFKKEDLDKRNDEFKAKFKDDAVRRVRLLFILDDIAHEQKIDTTEDDITSAYRSIAAQAGKAANFIKEHYEKESIVDNLKDKIREEKAIKFLLDNAVVTEV